MRKKRTLNRNNSSLTHRITQEQLVIKALRLNPGIVSVAEMRDVEASQRAGVRVAAVTWGFNSTCSLEALKPDLMFGRAEDLVEYLRSLCPIESPAF